MTQAAPLEHEQFVQEIRLSLKGEEKLKSIKQLYEKSKTVKKKVKTLDELLKKRDKLADEVNDYLGYVELLLKKKSTARREKVIRETKVKISNIMIERMVVTKEICRMLGIRG